MSKTYVVLDQSGKPNSEELEKRVQRSHDVDLAGIKVVLLPFSTQWIDARTCGFDIEHVFNGLTNGTETPVTRVMQDIIVSLAENGSLFANDRRLARNWTSFLVTPGHLIFTTSQHLLKFVHLTRDTEGEFPLI